MSALLVSKVSTRRDYWRNTAVTPAKIQSRGDASLLIARTIGPFLVGWSATLPLSDSGRVARNSETIARLLGIAASLSRELYRVHLDRRMVMVTDYLSR